MISDYKLYQGVNFIYIMGLDGCICQYQNSNLMIYDLSCPYHYQGRYDPEEKEFKAIADTLDKASLPIIVVGTIIGYAILTFLI